MLDVSALVGEIEKLLDRTIGENIELTLEFDPALEPVLADPSQLEQVVLNLAVNARDAMPHGGQLRFATEMVDVDRVAAERRAPMPPGRYVRLTITDTGTGIAPDIVPHIFEPFFTTKEADKGTGLGLATVYGIVKQSGGYVWVTSQLGLGTSFEIYSSASPGSRRGIGPRGAVRHRSRAASKRFCLLKTTPRCAGFRAPRSASLVHGAGSAGRRGRLAARAD